MNCSNPSHSVPTRRQVLAGASAAAFAGLAGASASSASFFQPSSAPAMPDSASDRRIFKSLKLGMFNTDESLEEKFAILKEVGFDGVEIDAPNGPDPAACLAATAKTGLPVDGVVDDVHWNERLTDPDPAVRKRGVEGLKAALHSAYIVRAGTVLLVPGHGNDGEVEKIEDLAEAGIRECLPLAAKLGVVIALENVWNTMFYDHDGPSDQTAERLAAFVDRFENPYLGVQFDIGNHQKYGKPGQWIRTLGKRIVKLDVKDWGTEGGFVKIGEGDVDWSDVQAALEEIGYTGWAAAEVAGGGRDRMQEISRRMDQALGL